MDIPSCPHVSPDERIIAALAHGTALLPAWGLVGAVLIWASQRRKSAFVAFHALQALAYQLMQPLFWMVWLGGLVVFLSIAVGGMAALAANVPSDDVSFVLSLLPQAIIFLGVMAGLLVYLLPALLGAGMILNRRDFCYPLLGRWMKKHLETEQTAGENETPAPSSEERLAAALSHTAILIPLIGLVVPLTIWISQKGHSAYLRFQAIQALAYQISAFVVYGLVYGAQMILAVGLFPLMLLTALLAYAVDYNPATASLPDDVLGGIVILLFLLYMGFIMMLNLLQILLGPLLALGGLWAAGLTLARRPCRYPLLGHLIGRWRSVSHPNSTVV